MYYDIQDNFSIHKCYHKHLAVEIVPKTAVIINEKFLILYYLSVINSNLTLKKKLYSVNYNNLTCFAFFQLPSLRSD